MRTVQAEERAGRETYPHRHTQTPDLRLQAALPEIDGLVSNDRTFPDDAFNFNTTLFAAIYLFIYRKRSRYEGLGTSCGKQRLRS